MPNRLADETSAYLLQHRDNPVDWFAWGPEPWARAKELDRPVLVSIGYSSCHWCHVMERESFEHPEIAELMNEQLVCIKVDREERPDVDQVYMDTVLRLIGHGGWPLNVFCAPDGRPFYGGTYFPPARVQGRPGWPDVVAAVARLYRERRSDVEQQSDQIMAALSERAPDAALPPLGELPIRFSKALMQNADRALGGFGGAPKFPTPTNLETLLLASRTAPDGRGTAGALEHVVFTCQRMARGGIFDQLGGGFHRYSTDARWLVPHFEKMLYDQGQLLRVLAEASRQSGDPELAWPIEETIDWLEREMRDARGGFFASQDADSEGEEGRFYVFDPAEVEAVLGRESGEAFCTAYAIVSGGTFENTGKSVLEHRLAGDRPRFAAERARLLAARSARVPPDTDRKQVTSWTAYTIGGLATAAATFDRDDWRRAAERAADFVLETLFDGDRLLRIFDGERARIPAFLDDHAGLLCGLLDLHRAGGNERYVELAIRLGETICARFFDPGTGELYLSASDDSGADDAGSDLSASDDAGSGLSGSGDAGAGLSGSGDSGAADGALPLRPGSDMDGATPSSAGLATLGLARLATLTGRDDFADVARRALEAQASLLERAPQAFPTFIRAAALLDSGGALALVLGAPDDPPTRALAARARRLLGPEDAVVVSPADALPSWLAPDWSTGREPKDEKPTAYLCQGRVCSLPATTPDDLTLPPT